jgi:hypothetical protein
MQLIESDTHVTSGYVPDQMLNTRRRETPYPDSRHILQAVSHP